jgi:hypothetical protein
MCNENKPLPKWGDMNPKDRHILLGKIVDAMIYSGIAVMELEMMVERFEKLGYVKSIFLPENEINNENSI